MQLPMPDARAASDDQKVFMRAQLVQLVGSLQPALSPEQYLTLGLQMQQCFQRQTLSTDQLLVNYFDVHMAVQRGEPLEAVVKSLQQLFDSFSGGK
jgi:hypothetical protein